MHEFAKVLAKLKLYKYLAAGYGGLKIFDVSNPASPALVSEIGGEFFGIQ